LFFYLMKNSTIMTNIKELREARMLLPDGFYEELLDTLHEGVYLLNRDRTITYWNKGAEMITGYRSDEVVGTRCCDNILFHVNREGINLCEGMCPAAKTVSDGTPAEIEVFLHHKDGHRVPVLARTTPIRDAAGCVVGCAEVFIDNSEKAVTLNMIEDLKKQAFVDGLTGMPNRRYMETVILGRLDELSRYGWPFGILFLDIDLFKCINDRHGHDTGDRTLKMVAKSLAHCSRSFDTVGRWGGEEFVAIIVNVDRGELLRIAQRYRVMVENSNITAGSDIISVTISIGATLAKRDESLEALIKRADCLMYRSKAAGRNRISTDDPACHSGSADASFSFP
jgi:diguanylate cyclase (GGDEF)-like protein/PAS domain S-box-containing protein